jgi:pimeloyl-ACP methyl ester carboxylesterase
MPKGSATLNRRRNGARTARITVTVRDPEWGGAAQIRCHQWRLADWDHLSVQEQRHVVYLPGALADFTPDAPLALLEMAAARELPLYVTVVDLPEFQASRLPPGWAGRLARADSLVDDARLLQAVLARVADGPYTVVGGSAGANLATILAALAPKQVEAVQLCMPAGFSTQSLLWHMIPGALVTTVLGLRHPAHRQIALGPGTPAAALEMLLCLGKLPALVQMFRHLSRAGALTYAARVRCPVAVVLGARDVIFNRLIPMAAGGDLAACFAQAPAVTVHVLPEADHNGPLTHRREVNTITLDLLTGGSS